MKNKMANSKKMDPNRNPIPEEMLFEILTRLPVKSICRFRCVSKIWLSIISDPDFVAAHLTHSRSRPKLLIPVLVRLPKYHITYFSIDYPQQDFNSQPLRATSNSSIDFPVSNVISTSPSGLICFTSSDGIKIGNPITGDTDLIPYPVSCHVYDMSFFGFDSTGKTHVILKLEKSGKSRVFDLAENRWNDISPDPCIFACALPICINGFIYFNVSHSSVGKCLYAFDVRLKRFQMIKCPPNDSQSFETGFLIEYKGRVALVGDDDLHGSSVYETSLWILEDQEKHIWSYKSLVVPWKENLMRDGISIDGAHANTMGLKVMLFGATQKGELILATPLCKGGSFYLFLYEMDTTTLRRFEVEGIDTSSYGYLARRLIDITESLQSPKAFIKKKG